MMRKRKQMDETQPKCHVEVCMKLCPYREKPFRVEALGLDNEKDDVVFLLKEVKRYEWNSCIVMYLKERCGMKVKSIEKDVYSFMRRHDARVMDYCPLRFEHLMSEWSNEWSN